MSARKPRAIPNDGYLEMHEAALRQLKPCPFCGAPMGDCCSGATKGVLCFVVCECGATMGEPGEIPEVPIRAEQGKP